MDEQQKMIAMDAWLDEVCEALDVDRTLLAEVSPAILEMVGQIAHGPSRPGGPMTAMAIGLAIADQDDPVAAVHRAIAQVEELLAEQDR